MVLHCQRGACLCNRGRVQYLETEGVSIAWVFSHLLLSSPPGSLDAEKQIAWCLSPFSDAEIQISLVERRIQGVSRFF